MVEDPSAEELRLYLRYFIAGAKYAEKFGVDQYAQKNVISISTLTGGAVGCLRYRGYNLTPEERDEEEDKNSFNTQMLRGTAIHDLINKRMVRWYSYEKLHVRHELPYEWSDGVTKTVVLIGHPDSTYTPNFWSRGLVCEYKTLDSETRGPEREKYVASVVKKATRQVGWYAFVLQEQLKRKMSAYISTIDLDQSKRYWFDPVKRGWIEETIEFKRRGETMTKKEWRFYVDPSPGFIMVNNGGTRVDLTEPILKKGYVRDSPIQCYKLPPDEIRHSYYTIRMFAYQVCDVLDGKKTLDDIKWKKKENENAIAADEIVAAVTAAGGTMGRLAKLPEDSERPPEKVVPIGSGKLAKLPDEIE